MYFFSRYTENECEQKHEKKKKFGLEIKLSHKSPLYIFSI